MSKFENNVMVVGNPLAQHHLTFMREQGTPNGRFRQHLKSLTRALFYEAMGEISEAPVSRGQFETTDGKNGEGDFVDSKQYVLIAIMRTGVGMMGAVHDSLEEADIGHAYYWNDDDMHKELAVNLPELRDRFIFVFDSGMISGKTAVALLKELVEKQAVPFERIAIITSTATKASIKAIQVAFNVENNPIKVITAAIDDWNEGDKFTTPGMGSMRERLYGRTKLRLHAYAKGSNNG